MRVPFTTATYVVTPFDTHFKSKSLESLTQFIERDVRIGTPVENSLKNFFSRSQSQLSAIRNHQSEIRNQDFAKQQAAISFGRSAPSGFIG
jgi:hypothetical protein